MPRTNSTPTADPTTTALLEVAGLVKGYRTRQGGHHAAAVRDVSFAVEPGQLFTLLGPSGCGKTTTLRCIAGLETPDAGHITVAGRVLYSFAGRVNLPANRRGLGMVFQSYAIWPHLSVFRNVIYPLTVGPRAQRPSRAAAKQRAERALAAVELEPFAGRPATELSGGQQQRLALARALVAEPSLLLLDEPLSNLDAKLRGRMRTELKRLQADLGITTVFVTHDQAEALAISDRMAVMRDGTVEQIGPPREIYERPATRFVADFIGSSNLLTGSVGPGGSTVEVPSLPGPLAVADCGGNDPGAAVVVAIRPAAVHLVEPGTAGAWPGTVIASGYLGDTVELLIGVGRAELRVQAPPSLRLEPGGRVTVAVDAGACRVLPAG